MRKIIFISMAVPLLALQACAGGPDEATDRFYAPEDCIGPSPAVSDDQAYQDWRAVCDHPRFLHHRHHHHRGR